MTYGIQFSGHKDDLASEEERNAFFDAVEKAAAAAADTFKEELADDAGTLTYATVTTDRGRVDLLAPPEAPVAPTASDTPAESGTG